MGEEQYGTNFAAQRKKLRRVTTSAQNISQKTALLEKIPSYRTRLSLTVNLLS